MKVISLKKTALFFMSVALLVSCSKEIADNNNGTIIEVKVIILLKIFPVVKFAPLDSCAFLILVVSFKINGIHLKTSEIIIAKSLTGNLINFNGYIYHSKANDKSVDFVVEVKITVNNIIIIKRSNILKDCKIDSQ